MSTARLPVAARPGGPAADRIPVPTVRLNAHATFTELSPARHVLPAPPRFQFGTCPGELSAFLFARTRLQACGIHVAHGLVVGAGLLLSAGGELVEAPSLNWQNLHVAEALARHGRPDAAPPRRVGSRCALIITPGYAIYGHWLADMLPRLGQLAAAGYDLDSLTYLIPHDVPAFGLELLRLLGLGEDRLLRLEPGAPVQPDELLLPTFPHNGRQFMEPMAYAAGVLRARIEARHGRLQTEGTPASILVSRRRIPARPLENRDAFEAMAVQHGFTVVHPQTLPVLDQLRLFAGAREIIGEYGSALHASLFSPPGTVVCALRGMLRHPALIQSGIGDALDQPTGYLFCPAGQSGKANSLAVDPDDLRACLDIVFSPKRPMLAPLPEQSRSAAPSRTP